jgi:hypothetical protein
MRSVELVLMVAGALLFVLVPAIGGFIAWRLWATYAGARRRPSCSRGASCA